jgi:hypothetical protein
MYVICVDGAEAAPTHDEDITAQFIARNKSRAEKALLVEWAISGFS